MTPGIAVERPVKNWELCLAGEADALLSGESLPFLLTPSERARLADFPTPKRRRDWLAGRLASKKALRALDSGLAWSDIEIRNERDGRPRASVRGAPFRDLSISHCAKGAVCAVSADGFPIGIDFEPVVARGPAVLQMFVHAAEAAPLDEEPALWQTKLWTAKEAVLKLLGIGLSCDPRDVRWFERTALLELDGKALRRWEQLERPRIGVSHEIYDDCLIAVARCGGL